MKVLYVYARPELKSFNSAMKDIAFDALKEKGHEIILPDLLSLPFQRQMLDACYHHRCSKKDIFRRRSP